MDLTYVLKQAWNNVVRYRRLWVLGVLLALTTFSGSWTMWSSSGDDDREYRWEGVQIERRDGETFGQAFDRAWTATFDEADRALHSFLATEFGIKAKPHVATILAIAAGTMLVLFIAGRVVRYVSESALIQMVDRHEESGQQTSLRRGLRLGWSRAAWRLFLIDLLLILAAIVVGVALFALILSPIALWADAGETTVLIAGLVTGALSLLAILALIVLAMLIALVRVVASRACVLEGLTVAGSIGRGYAILRRSPKDLLLTGLVTVGVHSVRSIAIGLAFLLVLSAGLLIGAVPAAVIANLSDPATLPAAIVGGVLFILFVAAPLVFLEGLVEIFVSSVWTLAFRQLRGLKPQARVVEPAAPLPNAALPAPSA